MCILITHVFDYNKNNLSCEGQTFSPITTNHLSPQTMEHKKTMIYDNIWNPCPGLGQAHKYGGDKPVTRVFY